MKQLERDPDHILKIVRSSVSLLNENPYDPQQVWRIYRLEIKGNNVVLRIDGAVIAQGDDNSFQSCGDQVGLLDEEIQAQVSSIEVIAL